MTPKTVLMPIYNGLRAFYFFRTDIYSELSSNPEIRLVIMVPGYKLEYYRNEFGTKNVVFEAWEESPEPWLGRVLHDLAFSLLDTGTIRAKQWSAYVKNGSLLKFFLKRSVTVLFGNNKLLRRAVKAFDRFVPVNPEVDILLDKYRPDLVLTPDIILTSDRVVLRAARRRGIPTVGMVRSWDNLTAKGVIQIMPDKLICQTGVMKKEAIELADMPPQDIAVLGVAQFDKYFKPIRASREKFCAELGIPTERRIVLCAPFFDVYSNKSGMLIVRELAKAIACGKLPGDVQLLVRGRPESRDFESSGRELSEELAKSGHVTIAGSYSRVFPKKNDLPDFEFSEQDSDFLVQSLYFSSVTINTISTLTIDAIALDKPVINIRFDGDPDAPAWSRVALFSGFDHYLSIERAGAVKLAYDINELIEHVNAYLADPMLCAAGRRMVRREQIEFTDGLSGKRTADFIKACLGINGPAKR